MEPPRPDDSDRPSTDDEASPAETSSTSSPPLDAPCWAPPPSLSSLARRGPGRPRKDPACRTPRRPPRPHPPPFGPDEETMPGEEPPPPFPDRHPGRACALCNLGERSQLGQGELGRFAFDASGAVSPAVGPPSPSPSPSPAPSPSPTAAGRRLKNINKCKTPSSNPEHTDELSIIGHPEAVEPIAVVDGQHVHVHRACADWSVTKEERTKEEIEEKLKAIVAVSLQRKCAFCLRYGASVPCRMTCSKYFHYPCALASGGFQEASTRSTFCKEHVYQAPLVCTAEIECHTCGAVGDIANLMTCCSCNAHYHGTCIGLPQLPGVRAGWTCKQCRVCQVCRCAGNDSGENRAIACEQCDKLYHASCIRPIMTTIPKYGWKCKCCRVCSDCGSRSPGAGASSRWHAHYTVCDSCYQQRNKGLSCPLCRRAYRAAAQREMVQCGNCKRFVHGTCDSDADLATYQQKKETIPEYDYVCPVCKIVPRAPIQRRKDSVDDENLSASQESLLDDVIIEQDPLALDSKMDIGLGKGKPFSAAKVAKKKISAYRFKSLLNNTSGKSPFNKKQKGYFMDFGRKRGTKTKVRGMFGIPGLGLQRPQAPDNKNQEEEPGVENRLVLCSSKDKFVLSQDLCVMCGALGTDSEGCLIACAQCGQTYHPYCVNVKATSVIVQKGWRCLDCTACEGCGRRDDEARLVLCDDCDVSYHTYCARPPLNSVPRGCWRCTRCRRCVTCGTTQPGPDNMWMNGYTECGPCASLVNCPSCATPYTEGELILQCTQCRRWLHAACDSIQTEQEADLCCQKGYNCLLCRPRDSLPPHLLEPLMPSSYSSSLLSLSHPMSISTRPPSPGEFFLDGVCLSAGGLRAIRSQLGDSTSFNSLPGRKKRRPKFDSPFDKNDGHGDSDMMDDKLDVDLKDDQVNCPYKEGMIWIVAQDGPPPDGFTTYTTESGTTVLRRKRQRNLNRVGIGGFTVRVRSQGKMNRNGEGDNPSDGIDGGLLESPTSSNMNLDKRKKPRRKQRSRLMESFPSYMQEAFFGRELLDVPAAKHGEGDYLAFTDSESEDMPENGISRGKAASISLNKDELLAIQLIRLKEEKEKEEIDKNNEAINKKLGVNNENELREHGNEFRDGPQIDKEAPLPNAMNNSSKPINNNAKQINERVSALIKESMVPHLVNANSQKENQSQANPEPNMSSKEDLSLLGVNLETMVRESLPNMDSRDVEEIFKGVLTDDSQESQESSVSFVNSVSGSSNYNPQRQQLSSPMEYPSPYQTEYSGSSQLSPAFSESSSHWSAGGGAANGASDIHNDSSISQPPLSQANQSSTYNQRMTEKMKTDEGLGSGATISAVLYANLNHPEWKAEFPNWPDRYKQILKKWRALAGDKKAPYLQQARDNRGAIRMKKAQQISKENSAGQQAVTADSGVSAAALAAELPATLPDQPAEVPLEKNDASATTITTATTNTPRSPSPPPPESNTLKSSSPVITTNITSSSASVVSGFASHFTLHHQFMPFYHGASGPAPNVTVNPFGKFTTAGGSAYHKTVTNRSVTPNATIGPHLTLGIVQQAQAQGPAASLVRHNITGALFSQALSFLGKSGNAIVQNGVSPDKVDGHGESTANRSRSSSPFSPGGDVVSDSAPSVTSTSASAPPSPSGDLHIRVLTPSEIMRTLPSMPQELAYEPSNQNTEQEKLTGQQRGAREAEQERQWKHLQQIRQQQAQQQQQVIHDQRLQGAISNSMARIRQHTSDGTFPQEQLQVTVNDQSPLHPGAMASPSPTMPRSPFPANSAVGRFPHPTLVQTRPSVTPQRMAQSPFSPQSPHDQFPGSVSPAQSQNDPFQRPPSENSGDFLHSPQTPRSFGHQSPNPARSPAYVNQNRMVPVLNTQEGYIQAPGTPRPGTQYAIVPQRNQIYAPRPLDPYMPSQNPALLSPRGDGNVHQPTEVNRQLKDLLTRQNSTSNKIWHQGDEQNSGNHNVEQVSEGQFRQPLPVSPIVRTRPPVAVAESRTRLILQQNSPGLPHQRLTTAMQHQTQLATGGLIRTRPPMFENMKNQPGNMAPNQHVQGEKVMYGNLQQITNSNLGKAGPNQLLLPSPMPPKLSGTTNPSNSGSANQTEEVHEMDMDKLEPDSANMAEVGDLLRGLGDDEDELLVSLTAEMGDDFNILEYADPELADFGDTSHILDGLELAEEENTRGQHVKRDPVDEAEEAKRLVKSEPPAMRGEKKEDNSFYEKTIKTERGIGNNSNQPTHQSLGTENNANLVPKLEPNQLINNQAMKFQQAFRPNAGQPHGQVQGQIQQSQFNLAQKINNRQVGQVMNVAGQQNQFGQMNKQTMVLGQQTNNAAGSFNQKVNPSQNFVSQQILARQNDQNSNIDQLNQVPQNQLQFAQGQQQQIRGQFISQPPSQQQQQAIQIQMQNQVNAAAALGRPMAPGTRLMSPDGAVGVVTANNTVTVSYPSFSHNRPAQGRTVAMVPRGIVRPAPPQPPPPYPGTPRLQAPPPPPPPYPSQMTHEASSFGVDPWNDWLRSRRPLLLQEQPLLLEDLLEQEKREQGRQVTSSEVQESAPVSTPPGTESSPTSQQWQQPPVSQTQTQSGSVQLFNVPLNPAPPLPPERITTEADQQAQTLYESWLSQQNGVLCHQLKYYETEVNKLRKIRKSLNSKQRQLRKSGNELAAGDAAELTRVSGEQAVLQKHLESARKQCRQHGMLVQEFRNKQQPPQSQLQVGSGNQSQTGNIPAGNSNQVQTHAINQQTGNVVPSTGFNQQQISSIHQQLQQQQQQRQLNLNSQQLNSIQTQANSGQQQPQANPGQLASLQQNTGQIDQHIGMGGALINSTQKLNTGQQVNLPSPNVGHQQQNNQIANNQHLNMGPVNINQQNMFGAQQLLMQQQQQQQPSGSTPLQQTMNTNQNLIQQSSPNQMGGGIQLTPQQQQSLNQQHVSMIQQRLNSLNQSAAQIQGNNQNHNHQQITSQQQVSMMANHQRPLSSPSPQMTVQMQQNIQSPANSHSPQMQSLQSGGASPHAGSTPPPPFSPQSNNGGRSPQIVFPRPQGSSLQTRFVRPPNHHQMHQQGMRVGVGFTSRQSSPLGSPQPLMSPGGNSNDSQRQQIIQRQQYSPMGQPPSSPLSRSPLIGNQPPSSPLSVRSPLIPSHITPSPSPQPDAGGGGGNPHAPHNPAPLPPAYANYRYSKLGLRGGSPMWGHHKPIKRMGSGDASQSTSSQSDPNILIKPRKESHISKVSILKKKPQTKSVPISHSIANTKIASLTSLVNSEYSEVDDSSSTPPISPGKISLAECSNEKKPVEKSSSDQVNIKIKNIKVIPEKKVSIIEHSQQCDEEIVLIESSPDENKHQILDYDDEGDKSFVGAEVSLCAAAGDSDQGDLSVIDSFPPVEISEIEASPVDSQEFVLFSSDGVDYTVDSDDSLKQLSFIPKDHSVVISYSRQTSESNGESNVHSPEGSEDEGHCINIDKSPSHSRKNVVKIHDDVLHESIDSEIVVISSNVASPEEHIATEEDFEELIDSGKPEETPEEEVKKEIVENKAVPTVPETTTTLTIRVPEPITTLTRTETTKKTVAVISLAAKPPQSSTGVHQFKIVNTAKSGTGITRLPLLSATVISPHPNAKILNEVSQATVASVSIANQTISVPVLKSINVPIVPLTSSNQGNLSPVSHLKKHNLSNLSSKPMPSVISVISSNMNSAPRMASLTLATTNTSAAPRLPIPVITQQNLKQKIAKALEKHPTLTISSSKLSLAVSQDATLPAKIFEDESASPEGANQEEHTEGETSETTSTKDSVTVKKPIVSILPKKSSVFTDNITIVERVEPTKPKDVDIESEITKHTEISKHFSAKNIIVAKRDIPRSPEKVTETIPTLFMEGDDEKNSEPVKKDNAPSTEKAPTTVETEQMDSDSKTKESSLKSVKAFINQSKDVILDPTTGISSEVSQDSIQISIPSPNSAQGRYLENITLQAHNADVNLSMSQKQVETLKEMYHMLNNIGESKQMRETPNEETGMSGMLNRDNDSISDIDEIIRQDLNSTNMTKAEHQEAHKSTIPVHVIMRSRESSQSPITVATSRITTIMPQLSPLSKPTELTTNIANASQQLRTIMSSINTSKGDSPVVSNAPIMKKAIPPEIASSGPVNFENLLPSTKVEVVVSKSSNRGLIENAILNSAENVPNTTNVASGSRVSNLARVRHQISPIQSPNSSPRNSPLLSTKSPVHSPLIISHQNFAEDNAANNQGTSVTQANLQMPALSRITSSTPQITSSVIQTSVQNTTSTSKVVTTNILSSTLLQTNRGGNNVQQHPTHTLNMIQPPALIMRPRTEVTSSSNQTNTQNASVNILNVNVSQSTTSSGSGSQISGPMSSKLLHSQLTSPLKRSKSTDEPKSENSAVAFQHNKRHSLESVIVKSEPMDCDDGLQNLEGGGCKFSSLNVSQKTDESQNVLLKQLLQNSGVNNPTVLPPRTSVQPLLGSQRTAPSLGLVQSLEAQLARPLIPPPHLPMIEQPKPSPVLPPRENLHILRPNPPHLISSSAPTMTSTVQSNTHSLLDVRKPPNKAPLKDEPAISTPVTSSPLSTFSLSSSSDIVSQNIRKDVGMPLASPSNQQFIPSDVKKELIDESSQQSAISGVSAISDQSKIDIPIKEELLDAVSNMDNTIDNSLSQESALEAKKRKRREYQQKRRQMQSNQKISETANNKKRPRKGSKFEEDYDTFIDSLMIQLRQLPPMQVQEPSLGKNFGVCPIFGSGDPSKLNSSRDYNLKYGELTGDFGSACIPGSADFYNTKPFGENEPIPDKQPASTQRGFYDQEFSPIRLDFDADDRKIEYVSKERDVETPDTIIGSSSPECCMWEKPYPFPGLKLIDDSESEDDIDRSNSPIIPIITPIPIRVKPIPLSLSDKEIEKNNINNLTKDTLLIKSKVIGSGMNKDNEENVTVTLTLTSDAAEDILGVLQELAGILHIPPPTKYKIIERTATPPHKLGLYRSKGKDGKEGTPIDIQSILNGAAKFCRHCDHIITDSVIRAKASEFPLLATKSGSCDLLNDSESDLYFCSTLCYKRFAWTPTNILADTETKLMETEENLCSNVEIKDKNDFGENMETEDVDIKPSIKDEKLDLSFMDAIDNEDLVRNESEAIMKIGPDDVNIKEESLDKDESEPPYKQLRGLQYKFWTPGCIAPPTRYKRPSDREITEMIFRTGVTVMPQRIPEDSRQCSLCHSQGDGIADGPSRLLNYDVDKWVHLNCALWSDGVYETESGALMNFENALQACQTTVCVFCERKGATVRCFKTRCSNVYHLSCAVKDKCVFHKNKTAHCASHTPKGEKENELTTLSVQRRVYVQRDEGRQVAAVMQLAEPTFLLRVGGLIFLSVGQLLPHQLPAFHTSNCIFPVGYQIIRFYWSTKRFNSRCRYLCTIGDKDGRPEFIVTPQGEEGVEENRGSTPRDAWAPYLTSLANLRASHDTLRLWPDYLTGEDLFGLTEPGIVRILESLPGIDSLPDYKVKYGRNPLLELPLAINPSGAARTEPRANVKGAQWRRALAVRAPPPTPRAPAPPLAPPPPPGENACPYSKQFVHSKSSQYKKMKQEWRNNVYLARSKIQGLGLYAARDLEKHTMVIEYIGEIIRHELSEIREKQYEARNRGIYMFRLDEERVVDATLIGGLARYINHSCNPNCVAEAVEVERDVRIIIFAKRRIMRGEELAYDYKFDIEDDAHKISCMCGAPNCRKWMN